MCVNACVVVCEWSNGYLCACVSASTFNVRRSVDSVACACVHVRDGVSAGR